MDLQASGRRRFNSGALLPVLLLCGAAASVHAQAAATRAALRAEVQRLSGSVTACAGAAHACDPHATPSDERVPAANGQPEIVVRWAWLQSALEKAGGMSAKDRAAAMAAAADRLAEMDRELGERAGPEQGAQFGRARAAASRILARAEFDKVAPPSWWDRLLARVWGWVGKLFTGVGRLGEIAPWLGKLLEWMFFLGAGAGLLLFVRRNFERQRLALQVRGAEAARSASEREATDWAALAERAAEAGEWREAVHCMYWAAIVRLEGRRLWRHNPARTPREYVRLLKPGTAQREALGGLTGLLERVWYGLRPAAAEDYTRAQRWFERLDESGRGAGDAQDAAGGARL